MIGMTMRSSVMSFAPKKCWFFFSTICLPCSHASSVNGPLQTILPASVHLSPCFSTDGWCAGSAALYAASAGK